MKVPAYAARGAKSPLEPFEVERRPPGPHDVAIEIRYCGVCHSDIHQARDEWGGSTYPMVPGHEIVGSVVETGARVDRWKRGDLVGVGCFVDSCRRCEACRAGDEQYCTNGASFTYNSREQDGRTPTFGGYSTRITVDENYVLRIPATLPPERAAPLLCAGITTYSPMRHFGVKAGARVAVMGLGGLGHMAVKLSKAFGAHVTVLSRSAAKRDDAARLGADDFLVVRDPGSLAPHAGRFHFILDTVSGRHDYDAHLGLLDRDGTMVLVGIPEPSTISAATLVARRRRLAGSNIGGIRETQEMLDFCAAHDIASDVEMTPIQKINEAYERVLKSDVRYRFVIDIASLGRVP